MHFYHKKTHTDGIWVSVPRELSTVNELHQAILDAGYTVAQQFVGKNFGVPMSYVQKNRRLAYRMVDSLLLDFPEVETWSHNDAVITDNILLKSVNCQVQSLVPEFWHIWSADLQYQSRMPEYVFSCFMNRVSGERSVVFYELIRRNLLSQGLVSYNGFIPGNNRNANDVYDYTKENLENQYQSAELFRYASEHNQALKIIPYNNVESHGTLEQCIIDSKVSLVIETYSSDSDITFSEKIFRSLQLPRPWILFCSPTSVAQLKNYGFDVLDDYVDHGYDQIWPHTKRLECALDQLETFVNKTYTDQDIKRFCQAAEHNQQLLKTYASAWPAKFQKVKEQIKKL